MRGANSIPALRASERLPDLAEARFPETNRNHLGQRTVVLPVPNTSNYARFCLGRDVVFRFALAGLDSVADFSAVIFCRSRAAAVRFAGLAIT